MEQSQDHMISMTKFIKNILQREFFWEIRILKQYNQKYVKNL